MHLASVGCKGLGKGDKVRYEAEYDDRKGKMRAVNVSLGSGNPSKTSKHSWHLDS